MDEYQPFTIYTYTMNILNVNYYFMYGKYSNSVMCDLSVVLS